VTLEEDEKLILIVVNINYSFDDEKVS